MPHPPFIMLDENSNQPIYRQIYETIRQAILTGKFYPTMPLPASRHLSKQLRISRMTVVNAYDQLLAEGYLESRPGSGTYVAEHLPEEFLQTLMSGGSAEKLNDRIPPEIKLSAFGKRLEKYKDRILENFGGTTLLPFQQGIPDLDNFPFEVWGKISQKWRKKIPASMLGYQDPMGYLPLRRAIADYLCSTRGLRCSAEQVLITNGIQQGLDLIDRVLLDKDDEFCTEDPGYAGEREFFTAWQSKMISVPLDAQGFDLKVAKRRSKNPRLIYLTPSFQYPLGITMSLTRRLSILEWADRTGAFIVEDDYNSEFRYASRPIASFQGLDNKGRVIYLGTFSKTIFPSLRLGCLVVPTNLIEIFGAARALIDYHSSIFDQAILADFIADRHFSRHIRKMRQIYQERQQIMLRESNKHLKGLLEITPADAGMHMVGWLNEGVDDAEVFEKAKAARLKVKPLSSLCMSEKVRSGLILGYTAFNEKQIKQGVKKLARILEEFS